MRAGITGDKRVGKQRLEAFSDGVIAIIITIMVLELKVPHEASPEALQALAPVFLSYALSFLVVAIIWVNHHHMWHLARRVNARVLWLNNHLLFWMSLIPFSTAFMGENHVAPLGVALYGLNLFAANLAFDLLRRANARGRDDDAEMQKVHRLANWQNLATILLYGISIPLAWISVWASIAIFVGIVILYFMPSAVVDRRSWE
jgi:uncharacterized membrane protein